MAFTKTDFRQFMDEIQLIKERKGFGSTWKEFLLKGIHGLRSPEKALDVKRKEYDNLYTNIYRKYDIVPDDLYSDLDKLWSEAIDSMGEIAKRFAFSTVPAPTVASMEYNRFWNQYVDATVEHARSFGQGQIANT